jgi:hypothetical protein
MKADFLVALIIVSTTTGCATSHQMRDERVFTQTVRLPIQRVIQALDKDAVFRAYLVKWDGRDIPIIAPTFLYSEGDIVEVDIKDRPHPSKVYRHRLLGFGFAVANPPTRPNATRSVSVPSEQLRAANARRRLARGDVKEDHLKVLEVYSSNDGDAHFCAYRVEWKGQEVVVIDSLAQRDYKLNDVIPVLVSKHEFPVGFEPIGHKRILSVILGHTAFGM